MVWRPLIKRELYICLGPIHFFQISTPKLHDSTLTDKGSQYSQLYYFNVIYFLVYLSYIYIYIYTHTHTYTYIYILYITLFIFKFFQEYYALKMYLSCTCSVHPVPNSNKRLEPWQTISLKERNNLTSCWVKPILIYANPNRNILIINNNICMWFYWSVPEGLSFRSLSE